MDKPCRKCGKPNPAYYHRDLCLDCIAQFAEAVDTMEGALAPFRKTTDLKLIDELLVLMKGSKQSWDEFENNHSTTVYEAMQRLRAAVASGEMPAITLSLARHFDK